MFEFLVSKKEAFQQGVRDYFDGKFYEDNPYTSIRLKGAWNRGWNHADLHDITLTPYKKEPVFKESVIDPPRKNYSSAIFENPEEPSPQLKDSVRLQVLEMVRTFKPFGKISLIWGVGSLFSKQYKETADLDITLVMEFETPEKKDLAVKQAISTENTVFIEGTKHPINVFVREDVQPDRWDDIYDIVRNEWLKQTEIDFQTVTGFFNHFLKIAKKIDLTKASLERDLVDFNILSQYSPEDISKLKEMVERKIELIDSKVKILVSFYKLTHALRKASYEKEYTKEEMERIVSIGQLPANVIYKLLERYHYNSFLKRLQKVLKSSGGEIDSPEEVELVKQKIKTEATVISLDKLFKLREIIKAELSPQKQIEETIRLLYPETTLVKMFSSVWILRDGSIYQLPSHHQDSGDDIIGRFRQLDENKDANRDKWWWTQLDSYTAMLKFGSLVRVFIEVLSKGIYTEFEDKVSSSQFKTLKDMRDFYSPKMEVYWNRSIDMHSVLDKPGVLYNDVNTLRRAGLVESIIEPQKDLELAIEAVGGVLTMKDITDIIEKLLGEVTTSAGAGAYEVPLGQVPPGQKKKKKKKPEVKND